MASIQEPYGDNPILSLYHSYKRSTNRALAWLFSKIEEENRPDYLKLQSTEDIVIAAKHIQRRNVQVPRYVLASLRTAIQQRTKVYDIHVSGHGRDQDIKGDGRHRAFIDRLQQAYEILSSVADSSPSSPSTPCSPSSPFSSITTEEPPCISPSNRYSCLEHAELDSWDSGGIEGLSETSETPSFDTSSEPRNLKPAPDTETILADDEFGEMIEMCGVAVDIARIGKKLDEYWTEVADQRLSPAIAGSLTNAAYAMVQETLKSHPGFAPNRLTLLNSWADKKAPIIVKGATKTPSDCDPGGRSYFLCNALRCITERQGDDKQTPRNATNLRNAKNLRNPAKIITFRSDATAASDSRALNEIVDGMRQKLPSQRAISPFEWGKGDCEPLLVDMLKTLDTPSVAPSPSLATGLELLLSTYKAYMWPHNRAHMNPRRCRVTTLQLAQEILDSVNKSLEQVLLVSNSEITFTLKFLLTLRDAYTTYLQERRFDLYYEAPWVASGHMTHMLTCAMNDGLHLCFTNNILAGVLHIYNAVRQVNPQMPKVLWLEELCTIFTNTIFLGAKPTENFASIFRRSTGARLKKEQNAKRETSYTFTQPNKPRIGCVRPEELSIFYEFHEEQFRASPGFWVKICRGRETTKPTVDVMLEAKREIQSTRFLDVLDKVKNAIVPEFEGDVPIARIDFFVSRALVQTLDDISTKFNPALIAPDVDWALALIDVCLNQCAVRQRTESLTDLIPKEHVLAQISRVLALQGREKSLRDFCFSKSVC